MSSSEVHAAAMAAARAWGYPQPELLRHGMAGVFAAGADVVLRVGPARAAAVAPAEELLAAGVRVPRPLRHEQFAHGAWSVTAVERVHAEGSIDWEAVGEMVARVHGLPVRALPWCGEFAWWQFDDVLGDVAADIDDVALAALRDAVRRSTPLLDAARHGPLVVCHGDVHPGNVVPTRAGPVLLDWDQVCLGPAAWDHAALLTWTERWGGEAGMYEAFSAGYGRSVRGDRLAEALAELRLVAATAMRVRAGRADPAAAAEASRRLRWWRGEPDAPAWHPA